MNKLITLATSLNSALLSTNEEEYDRIAYDVVQQFSKLTDLASGNLDTLDPSYQTIPFLYVLDAQIAASHSTGKAPPRQLPAAVLPEGRLWAHISNLLLTFDPVQVRYVGSLLVRVTEIVARGAEQTGDVVPAIQLLQNTILRLDPASSTLTTTHYKYVQLCLFAQGYTEASVILDRPIYSIPSPEVTKQVGNRAYQYLCSTHDSSSSYLTSATGLTQKLTSRSYMEYFLMSGMCYMGMGEYQKALLFLETVLVMPTIQSTTSAVQLEAYKKWVLLNLLVNGTSADLPKSMSQNTARTLRTLAKPYECVVEAFKSGKIEQLQEEIEEGADDWQDDNNYGLIFEVFAAFQKYTIFRLEKTYTSLSLEEVARLTSFDPTDVSRTATYVAHLIESEQLQAELVPSSNGGLGVLRFTPGLITQLSEADVEKHLALRSRELQLLLKHISEIDYQMEISKEYIEHLQKLKGARDREKKGNAGASRSMVADMHDEDMMDDM